MRFARLLDAFYDESASADWEYDGLLNKTIGDAVMAVFNFPIKRVDHARDAVLAARGIQRRWHAKREMLGEALGVNGSEFGIEHWHPFGRTQLRGVRPVTSRFDRYRECCEHRLAGTIGR